MVKVIAHDDERDDHEQCDAGEFFQLRGHVYGGPLMFN